MAETKLPEVSQQQQWRRMNRGLTRMPPSKEESRRRELGFCFSELPRHQRSSLLLSLSLNALSSVFAFKVTPSTQYLLGHAAKSAFYVEGQETIGAK